MKRNEEEIKLVKDWLRIAKENLLVAQSGITADYAPYHTICFLCQSSAEKYLKAFLIWRGWELRKTHNLNELLLFCVDFEPEFGNLKEECGILNQYITAARYPGNFPFGNINENHAEEAIESTEKIEAFVLKRIELSM